MLFATALKPSAAGRAGPDGGGDGGGGAGAGAGAGTGAGSSSPPHPANKADPLPINDNAASPIPLLNRLRRVESCRRCSIRSLICGLRDSLVMASSSCDMVSPAMRFMRFAGGLSFAGSAEAMTAVSTACMTNTLRFDDRRKTGHQRNDYAPRARAISNSARGGRSMQDAAPLLQQRRLWRLRP